MILFLDFDGVLHPVRQRHESQDLHLRRLFCFEKALAQVLEQYAELRIVLSTNWRYEYDLPNLRAFLPELGHRVISRLTLRPLNFYHVRHEFIAHLVERDAIRHWIAIDDDAGGRPEAMRKRLVACDSYLALGEPGKLDEVATRLRDRRDKAAAGGGT